MNAPDVRALGACVLASLTACAPAAPIAGPAAVAPVAQATPAVAARRGNGFGSFAAYRMADVDPYARGPATWNPASPPASWPASGSQRWSWGFSGFSDGRPLHYLVLQGQPDDDPASLIELAHAPAASLPAGARLLFYGKTWSPQDWVFETVGVSGTPILDAADLATCTLADGEDHDTTQGQDIVSEKPWLKLRFTPEGEKKVATLPPNTPLVVAFGEAALSLGWFPSWTATSWTAPDFPVEGRSATERRARASALIAACGAAGRPGG